jgi:hypothetical protein
MRIFDNIARTDGRPSRNSESTSAFLNRAAGPYWDQVRAVIEDWYGRYPNEEKKDLRARIRSGDEAHVYAALWELYLHEMLLCAGYEVECHPVLEETSSRPDFRAFSNSGQFYIEARRLSGSATEVPAERRRNAIFDEINKVNSPNFFLSLEIRSESDQAPPTGKLKTELAEWLNQLDPDDYFIEDETGAGFESWPVRLWEQQGWRIVFRAIPKSPSKRGLPNRRTIGVYPSNFSFANDSAPISKALKVKGSKYGALSAPYVIALATSSISHEQEDMEKALYGSLVESIDFAGSSSLRRIDDGYWSVQDTTKHSVVSAILTVHNPAPWTWTRNVPSLWINPHSDFIHAPAFPSWRRVRINGTSITVVDPTEPTHVMLDLQASWPLGEPFAHLDSNDPGE